MSINAHDIPKNNDKTIILYNLNRSFRIYFKEFDRFSFFLLINFWLCMLLPFGAYGSLFLNMHANRKVTVAIIE
jgi:hypothetical protein